MPLRAKETVSVLAPVLTNARRITHDVARVGIEWSNGGINKRATRSESFTSSRSADSIAIFARSGSPPPPMMAHDCDSESIALQNYDESPRGEPSSKKPRRYHSPSQHDSSSALCNCATRSRHWLASATSRVSASSATWGSTEIRNQASQTLSPRPGIPTLLRPSFQSQWPIRGKPLGPGLQRLFDGAPAVFPQRCGFGAMSGVNRCSISPALSAGPSMNGTVHRAPQCRR